MSFGKDSISHESITDQKTKSVTHPLSFTFQIASATPQTLAVSPQL